MLQHIDQRLPFLLVKGRRFRDQHGGNDRILVAAMIAGQITVAFLIAVHKSKLAGLGKVRHFFSDIFKTG